MSQLTPAASPPAAAGVATLLHGSLVSWDDLHERYGALLPLVEALIGVVPDCDRYLEIWPPAFRSYNMMVPNLLNLPVPLLGLGGPPASAVGLGMYVASRTAECPYCSAHCCSFAMRRGAEPAKVAAALLPDRDTFTAGELAVIAVAKSLARVPCELTAAEKADLIEVFGEKDAEQIVLGVVMMGFLNKFMDATGVELEQAVVSEVGDTMGSDWAPGRAGAFVDPAALSTPPPPADGLRRKLRLLPLLPGAIRWDRRAQHGTPKGGRAIADLLVARTGHDFPVLARLRSARARRGIASMLFENLDPSTTVVGLEAKVLTGAIFATVVGNEELLRDMRALAGGAGVTQDRIDTVVGYARGAATSAPGRDDVECAVLALALDAAPSPARTDETTAEVCRAAGLAPAAIVEVITWLAVLQLLHRLACYTGPSA